MKVNFQRVLSLFLCLCLCFLFLPSRASASSYVPGQYDVVDLLQSGFFPAGTVMDMSGSNYTFFFTSTSTAQFAHVYAIISGPTPNSVSLNGISGRVVSSPSAADVLYEFDVYSALDQCNLNIRYGSSMRRKISISYLVGTVSTQTLFTQFNLKSRGYNNPSWSYSNNRSIPFNGRYRSLIASSVPATSAVNDFDCQFSPPSKSSDYFTFHLVVPEYIWDDRDSSESALVAPPSFYIIDGPDGAPVRTLNVIESSIFLDSDYIVGIGRHSYHYVYTVDISGYDLSLLSNPLISCKFTERGYATGSPGEYLFNFDVLSCCIGYNADSGDSFRAFPSWLGRQFSDLTGSVHSDIQSVISAINPTVPSDVSDSQQSVDDKVDSMSNFEQQQYDSINSGVSDVQGVVSGGIGNFGSALAFVQTYTTNIADGIEEYLVVFTLPIFVGIFLYACSRAPGVTRAFRDRRPKE